MVGVHTSSHTILVVTWSDLIGLHSWLQRYKLCIGMTPDPSSLLRRGWPARLKTDKNERRGEEGKERKREKTEREEMRGRN